MGVLAIPNPASAAAPPLGTAASYSVLAGSTVTNTGATTTNQVELVPRREPRNWPIPAVARGSRRPSTWGVGLPSMGAVLILLVGPDTATRRIRKSR